MDEKNIHELMKNCFGGSTEGTSCCGPANFSCCGGQAPTENDQKSDEKKE